ncbi:MAG: hypothetical protein HY900_28395, partial [Deltaproteobacteria bacterium]|nr:hypothetical protein [Deltaproteobacteria bacterium]
MSSEQLSRTRFSPAETAPASVRNVEEALCALYRSIGAHQFYPPGHPVRTEALREAYGAWRGAETDPRWAAAGVRVRAGGLWCGREHVGRSNPAVLSLARVLSTHGLAALSLRAPLPFEGFVRLVALLADNPENLAREGGALAAWQRSPFTPCLELFAFTVALPGEARKEPESRNTPGEEVGAETSEELRELVGGEERVLELLVRLGRTADMTAFLAALQELAVVTREMLGAQRYADVYRIASLLRRRARALEAEGRPNEREYLLETLRLLVRGGFLSWLVERVAIGEEKEAGALLREVGRAAVVPLVNALIAERRRAGRRRLVEALIAIGEPVV